MIFDYVCFIAKWSILGTTHHRIVPNDRASRFLHWRRKRKLKPLMLAVFLALIHSVGSFTGIYSEKTLYKSLREFHRPWSLQRNAKVLKSQVAADERWCMADVVLLMFRDNALKYDVIQSRKPIYLYIYYYIIVRFDEIYVSFMDPEKDCQCSKSFSIFRNKATCQRQWCTWMYAELYQTLIPKQILKISHNFRWQKQDVLRNLSSQQITKNTTRISALHKGSEQVRLTMRQGQRVVSWSDAKRLNTKQVTEVTEVTSLDVRTNISKFLWLC